MIEDWPNFVGWMGTLLFLLLLGGYIRYRIERERSDDEQRQG
jgi:hypothetical protein